MIELCKVAAPHADRHGRQKIAFEDLAEELTAFGDRRIEDTVAEFKSQSDTIAEMIGL